MKLFGFNFYRKKVTDQVLIRTVQPSTKPISSIAQTKIGSLSYSQQFAKGRGTFMSSEYDLSEIGVCEDVDGFVRQAFKKKEGLMFKEGIKISGPNKDTIRYYKTRMAQIARASGIPELLLLRRVAKSLIRVSNAFLIKVRDEKASGGKVRVTPDGKTLRPIAGYFPAAPETMRVDLNPDNGKINKWRQLLPDGRYKDFNPDDVIHFTIDKREGFFFGVPGLVPVLDDIRALRQIEENIELLLYQHLFPLFHYKVGTETAPAGYTEDGTKEIDAVQGQIRFMPSEGALVTPERHEIKAIGSEGRAVRAEGYLEHFKKRVFSGLGVSSVDMGEANTSNRATAFTMSRAMVDSVKAIQDELEAQWDHHVIAELLLESTFGADVLEEDNMVHLQFHEIDIQNKIDLEKHSIELWKANGLTHEEFRASLGREPIPIPEDPEDQDLSKYPEWSTTYWKLIEEPMTLMKSIDEPWSPQAQAIAQSKGSAVTNGSLEKAKQEKEQQAEKSFNRASKLKPTLPASNNKPVKDNIVTSEYSNFEIDTINRIKSSLSSRSRIDKDYIESFARVWVNSLVNKLHSSLSVEFIKGFNLQTGNQAYIAESIISAGRKEIYNRIHHYINKLAFDTLNLAYKRIDEQFSNVKIENVNNVIKEIHLSFDTLRYRTQLIMDTEMKKSFYYGNVLGMKFHNVQAIQLKANDNSCDQCKQIHNKIIPISQITLDDVPPLHPNSRLKFVLFKGND